MFNRRPLLSSFPAASTLQYISFSTKPRRQKIINGKIESKALFKLTPLFFTVRRQAYNSILIEADDFDLAPLYYTKKGWYTTTPDLPGNIPSGNDYSQGITVTRLHYKVLMQEAIRRRIQPDSIRNEWKGYWSPFNMYVKTAYGRDTNSIIGSAISIISNDTAIYSDQHQPLVLAHANTFFSGMVLQPTIKKENPLRKEAMLSFTAISTKKELLLPLTPIDDTTFLLSGHDNEGAFLTQLLFAFAQVQDVKMIERIINAEVFTVDSTLLNALLVHAVLSAKDRNEEHIYPLLKFLIESGANRNTIVDKQRGSPLIFESAQKGFMQTVKYLLETGAAIDFMIDKKRFIDHAVSWKNQLLYEQLLQAGQQRKSYSDK